MGCQVAADTESGHCFGAPGPSEQWMYLEKRREKKNSLTCQILSESGNVIASPIMRCPFDVVLSAHFLASPCTRILRSGRTHELTQYLQEWNMVTEKYFAIISNSIIFKFVHI